MEENKRGLRKTKVGTVTSDRIDKSVVVSVERLTKHPLYGKYIKRRVKFTAHDEKNECKVGDKVVIAESHPISKRKVWRVKQILERAI
ncbi:MAG: 30S ribosomal protein S17 [Deltaproteobacteria bacterium GWC2_42_11]|nr:MAG: 30S ribosomal protein S17 [Deltaproteobacteria bacterium GWC2_42_11]HBO85229.1 30S ribosomal protein S17 [Deltaproteobacteria bacterium]